MTGSPVTTNRIGVDVGGTKIESVLLDQHCHVVDSTRIPSPQGNNAVRDGIVASVRTLLASPHIDSSAATTVGIGVPGQVDSVNGIITSAVNLGIESMALTDEVSHALSGLRVHAENDVNAAALGAAQSVAVDSQQPAKVVFINFGTGLACGVVLEGRLLNGATGSIGELGHVPVEPHGLPCMCGQHGCLETVASGGAIERLWPCEGPALPDMIAKAARGDRKAQETLDMILDGMVTVIQLAAQAYDPDLLLLGGGVTKTGQPLMDLLKSRFQEKARHSAFLDTIRIDKRLRLIDPGEPIGAIGAALSID